MAADGRVYASAGTPAIGKSHIFAPCGGKIYAIDRQTHQAVALGPGNGPIALAGDRLYYTSVPDATRREPYVAAMQAVAD